MKVLERSLSWADSSEALRGSEIVWLKGRRGSVRTGRLWQSGWLGEAGVKPSSGFGVYGAVLSTGGSLQPSGVLQCVLVFSRRVFWVVLHCILGHSG